MTGGWGTGDGGGPSLYWVKLFFQDFVRLQIGSNWFVISEPLSWRVEFKMKKISVTEIGWNIDGNGVNGMENRFLLENDITLNHDFNGDGIIGAHTLAVWQDDPGAVSFGVFE
jgi:hypothetical protein